MDNNRRQQLLEQYEDIAFSLLMDDYENDEGQRLLEEFEEVQKNGEIEEIPPELDRKCRELINRSFAKQQRTLWLQRSGNFLSRVAVVALVILGIATVTVLSVDAFRIPVLNFLMDQSGKYSTLIFDSNDRKEQSAPNRIISNFESNLPEGYSVLRNTYASTSGLIYCTNQDRQVIFLDVTITERGINIDTEDTTYHELDFGEYKAVFSDENGYNLRWLDQSDNTIYSLYSNGLDQNTFWEFAYIMIE